MSDSLVSLTEAARRLTEAGDKVDRSTLSRYVRQHAAALSPAQRGKETVVDFERLAAHRRANSRISDTTPFDDDVDFGIERAGKTRAERLRIELDLGERQGVLTVIREVENAAHAAVGAMRNALSNAAGDTAEAIAKAVGIEAGTVRPHIRAYERLALKAFIRGLTENHLIRAEDLDQAPDEDDADGRGA